MNNGEGMTEKKDQKPQPAEQMLLNMVEAKAEKDDFVYQTLGFVGNAHVFKITSEDHPFRGKTFRLTCEEVK